jgi:hypothetical protein
MLTPGLQRSPAPSERASNSSDGWETAQSYSSADQEPLPSVAERAESAIKTPRKTAIAQPASAAQATKSSQLPQPSTATPTRTPKNRTGNLVLPSEEMHPAQHHASTAKPRDEARWLGFQTMDAHTAPPKSTGQSAGQTTPSKTPAPVTPGKVKGTIASLGFPFQGFNFRVKSPVASLSPSSSSILKGYKDAPVADARALFKADEFTAPEDMGAKRKTAVPTGKMSRFSDVHMVSVVMSIPSMYRILSTPETIQKNGLDCQSSLCFPCRPKPPQAYHRPAKENALQARSSRPGRKRKDREQAETDAI